MISVADLIKENRIPANFFDYNAYVKGDLEIGLLGRAKREMDGNNLKIVHINRKITGYNRSLVKKRI